MSKKLLKILPALAALPLLAVIYLPADEASLYADEGYLFEVLENPVYRKTWDKLLATQQSVDDWLAEYSQVKNGPATPANKVQLDGKDYQINFVCKAHDCGDNHFVVMFNADGTQAWGVLRRAHQGSLLW